MMETAQTTWTSRCPTEFDQLSQGWLSDAFKVDKVSRICFLLLTDMTEYKVVYLIYIYTYI